MRTIGKSSNTTPGLATVRKLIVGVVSLSMAPVLYAMNYFCVTRLIDDESMRPPVLLRAWAGTGLIFMTLAAGFYVFTRI